MTKLATIGATQSLEDLLIEYAEHLTDDEASAKIRGLAVVGLNSDGSPFFSVLKSVSRLELVGVLESLKLFLLDQGDVE